MEPLPINLIPNGTNSYSFQNNETSSALDQDVHFKCVILCTQAVQSHIHTLSPSVDPEPRWRSPGAPSSAESPAPTGDKHGQLLLQILHLQHQRSEKSKHALSQVQLDQCVSLMFVCIGRGVESGGERGLGRSHGWSLLHRTGAQHSPSQTQQQWQPGPPGTDWHQSKQTCLRYCASVFPVCFLTEYIKPRSVRSLQRDVAAGSSHQGAAVMAVETAVTVSAVEAAAAGRAAAAAALELRRPALSEPAQGIMGDQHWLLTSVWMTSQPS